jgi:Tfp pilus assembly protein PilW
MVKRAARSAAGLTLVELLVGLGLVLAAAAILATLARTTLGAWRRAAAHAAATDEALGALEHLTRDLRVAGYDPLGRGVGGLVNAAADRVTITADLDGDGRIDARSAEHVAYQRARGSGDLLRVVGRQALPILSALAPDGLTLTYRDAEGGLVDAGRPEGARAVRTVAVALATRAAPPRPAVRVAGGARLLNR